VSQQTERESTPPEVRDLNDQQRNEIYEAAKNADHEIPRLQALSMQDLVKLAEQEGLSNHAGLAKQELIFQLLKRRVTGAGLGWGEGVLDILPDGFGFLRSSSYSYNAGPDDIYVSPSQIRRLNLKQGHLVAGPVRPPKEGEKYFALLHVEQVNGGTIEQLRKRIAFDELTAVPPSQRVRLEHADCDLDIRLIDLLAPMGKGQRTLIMTPPLSGRSELLTHLAQAILANDPDVYVILLVIDERPEDITEIQRRTGPDDRREVAASSFDEPASRHVALAEIVTEKARRMVEAGQDVVVLMDSLTALTRAYNTEAPHSGKILSTGLDAAALQRPKRLFGSGRATEEAGSLTVIATALTNTGSRMDEVICEQFAGKGNSQIILSQELAELHVYPAIDIAHTGSTREKNLLEPEELEMIRRLRKQLSSESTEDALEKLLEMVGNAETNAAFLKNL